MDAGELLRRLSELAGPERGIVDDAALAEALKVPVSDVQNQLAMLEEAGYVRVTRTFAKHSAWLTPKGELALKPSEGATPKPPVGF